MKLLVLLLSSQICFPARAEVPDGGFAYTNCPPAPPKVKVDGGYFIVEERDERLACIITTCETSLGDCTTAASEAPATLPGWVWFLAGVAAAAAAKVTYDKAHH